MVRLLSVLAVTVAAFAFVPSADAGDRGDRGRIGGEITAIHADRGAFELTRGDRTVLVVTGDRTRFVVNGHRAHFEDLEVGMRARAGGRWHKNDEGDRFFRARRVQARSGDER